MPNRWVLINPESLLVEQVIIWDGVSHFPFTKWVLEPYDPKRHPPIGLNIPVGEGWMDIHLQQLKAEDAALMAKQATATTTISPSDTSDPEQANGNPS